jgi:hypothetical protein
LVASGFVGDILPRKPFPPIELLSAANLKALSEARLLHGTQKFLAERKESL